MNAHAVKCPSVNSTSGYDHVANAEIAKRNVTTNGCNAIDENWIFSVKHSRKRSGTCSSRGKSLDIIKLGKVELVKVSRKHRKFVSINQNAGRR